MGDNRNIYNVLLGINKEKVNKEGIDIGGKILLKWILKT
jgi:hypothetical protein